MAGFSPEWLTLREPADHRARNAALASEVSAYFDDRDGIQVVDLGCGTGSNLRALAPLLPGRQLWRLVDYDAGLLAAARQKLGEFATVRRDSRESLVLDHEGREITVAFVQADLNRDLNRVLDPRADLVTAAALFDLVSEPWIEAFAARLSRRRLPLYTTLIYDGTEHWSPPHHLDHDVLGAFIRHQGADKGFGPAAGPRAGPSMAASFARAGYAVMTAGSPWRLTDADRALIDQLARGIADAAVETGEVNSQDALAWAKERANATQCMIGHVDLWARPI
jgi:hypothetical protein